MWRYCTIMGLLLIAAWLWPIAAAQSLGQGGVDLLTLQEAERLRMSEEEWLPPPTSRTFLQGPRIIVRRPQVTEETAGPTIETTSPLDLFVLFEQNRAPVDMRSLEIKARKGIFSKSLTTRLKPYIEGTSLQAKEVKIPTGRFLIQIAIADQNGTVTDETYRLLVRSP